MVFCVWLSATVSATVVGTEHLMVPVTVAVPVFSFTATLGPIVMVTVA